MQNPEYAQAGFKVFVRALQKHDLQWASVVLFDGIAEVAESAVFTAEQRR